jgi:hypothetical protein
MCGFHLTARCDAASVPPFSSGSCSSWMRGDGAGPRVGSSLAACSLPCLYPSPMRSWPAWQGSHAHNLRGVVKQVILYGGQGEKQEEPAVCIPASPGKTLCCFLQIPVVLGAESAARSGLPFVRPQDGRNLSISRALQCVRPPQANSAKSCAPTAHPERFAEACHQAELRRARSRSARVSNRHRAVRAAAPNGTSAALVAR